MFDFVQALERELPQGPSDVSSALHQVLGRAAARRRRRRAARAGIVALAVGATVIGAVEVGGNTSQSVAAEVDTQLGGAPVQAHTGLGALWVMTCQRDCQFPRSSGQLLRVNPATGQIVSRLRVANPSTFVIADRSLWLADFWTGRIRRIDPRSGRTTAVVSLRLPGRGTFPDRRFLPTTMSADGATVWVGSARGWLAEIAAASGRLVSMVRVPDAGQIAAGRRGLWVAQSNRGLGLLRRASHSLVTRALPYGRHGRVAVDQVVVGGGRVWLYGVLARPFGGSGLVLSNSAIVGILDERTGTLMNESRLAAGPNQIALTRGGLLVANLQSGRILRVRRSGRTHPLQRVRPGGTLAAVTPGAVWATTRAGTLRRIALPGT